MFRHAGSAKRGFTLVEVIVVLVILAILAAIAIPALTGYIDKAKWRDVELRGKTQLTAIQTMIAEAYAEDGGLRDHSEDEYPKFGDMFERTGIDPDQTIMEIGFSSDQFYRAYESLTGDTYSFRDHSDSDQSALALTSLSGAVLLYAYTDFTFFSSTGFGSPGDAALLVFYLADIDSAVADYFFVEGSDNFFDSMEEAKQAGFRSGFNIAKLSYVDKDTNALERLN